MTQAYNLAILANAVNTSGQLNVGTNATGTLPVANGGTGSTSLTANRVLLGNGTSSLQEVAPGTNGNVLTSNGTTWVSQAPAGGGVTSLNGQTGAITTTNFDSIGGICILLIAGTTQLAFNATIAGSSLRYNYNFNTSVAIESPFVCASVSGNTTYIGGGTATTGTWRKLNTGLTYYNGESGNFWSPALYVRIS